jgi:hypothetical protein
MSGDPRNVCQHREWTDRKIDTNEDGAAVRNDVALMGEGDLKLMPGQYEDLKGQLQGIGMMTGWLFQQFTKVNVEEWARENGWTFDEFFDKTKDPVTGKSRYDLFLDTFNNAGRLEEVEDLARYSIDCMEVIAQHFGIQLPAMPDGLVKSDTTPNPVE